MNAISRIALGTANFGKAYGLSGKRVEESEQKEILDYCKEIGIDMIDTATAYEWDWTQTKGFKYVVRINERDTIERIHEIVESNPYCLMAHDHYTFNHLSEWLRYTKIKKGISLYESFRQFVERAVSVVQLPYSVFDRRFEREVETPHVEMHVRSIFLQGAVFLKKIPDHLKPIEDKIRHIQGYDNPALTCILFCLLNPHVDRVIMGVDSLKQLQQNTQFFRRLDEFEVKDEKILDPRQWPINEKEPK